MRSTTWLALAAAQTAALIALSLCTPIGERTPADGLAGRAPDDEDQRPVTSLASTPAPSAAPASHDRVTLATQQRTFAADSPLGLIVTGFVRDSDGNPLPGAHVYFEARSAPPPGTLFDDAPLDAFPADADATARFAALGLWPGEWDVTARAKGASDLVRRIQLTAEPARTHLDLVLHAMPDEIDVVLVDETDRAWIPDESFALTLEIQREPLPPRIPMQSYWNELATWLTPEADSEAFARLRPRTDLPLHVGVVCGEHVVAQVSWTEPERDLRIPLSHAALQDCLAELQVRVSDSTTGQAIPDAKLVLAQVDQKPQSNGVDRFEATTDALGRATFTGQRPRRALLSVRADGYGPFQGAPELAPGQDTPVLRIALGPARRVAGRVLAPDGNSQFVFVSAVPLERDGIPPSFLDQYSSGGVGTEQGRFELTCGTGRYLILARRWEDGSATAVVDTAAGDVSDLTLRFTPATLVRLRAPGPRYVVLRDDDGTPVNWATVGSMPGEDLYGPAGTWTLESWSSVGPIERRQITLPLQPWEQVELR